MIPTFRRRRPRALGDDERRLWDKVTETIDPLGDARPHRRSRRPPVESHPAPESPPVVEAAVPPPPAAPEPPKEKRVPRIVRPTGPTRREPARAAATIHVKHTPTPEGLAPPVAAPPSLAALDDRTRRRLARGLVAIDARLDLHGMTQEAAHSALRHFLVRARGAGARIVLVITGKGRGGPGESPWDRGVLRRAVPHWLADSDVRDLVIGFEEAHLAHGGAGAIYVRLRRPRGGRPA
ncbi:hypothetical protein EYW49_15460 [Siculibacillus lacustris]|uniref:Smr domain-containing protein n=1 Tax=Siculibacillus lacustris TaxID=1549641 RepID=A0A4Q9VLC4_9HYPH|nr:Smr/MutS family protein [Siculibacillus lacustris]TBW35791.1 hypothetical protein EYW49_15460 [Siculibacillus lacustris]